MGTLDCRGAHVFYCQAPGIPVNQEALFKRLDGFEPSEENVDLALVTHAYFDRNGDLKTDVFRYIVQIVIDNALNVDGHFFSTGVPDLTRLKAFETGRAVGERLRELQVGSLEFHLDRMFGGQCFSPRISRAFFSYNQILEGIGRSCPDIAIQERFERGSQEDYVDELP